jgi:hypothetical protein
MKENELYHHGVLGMKWGRRKAQPVSAERRRYDAAKDAKKSARKEYTKAFNKAYGYSSRYPISQFTGKKRRAESNKRWGEAQTKAKVAAKADQRYKEAKRNLKESTPYKTERTRQKKHIATKNTIRIGSAAINRYLSNHQVTRNGKAFRVSPMVTKTINTILDYKYYKDSYK